MNLTEPTYISVRDFGRKIQHAFAQAETILIEPDYTSIRASGIKNPEYKAVFILPDQTRWTYYEYGNELWYSPVSEDPATWYVVNRPYSPTDTL
jgi:hypothetical protein